MFAIKPSGKWVEELQRRQKAFSGKDMSASLTVPPELQFLYYQEFGTVGGYPIVPVNAKVLAWPDPAVPGGIHEAMHVTHPGVKPTHMIQAVLDDIGQAAAFQILAAMVQSGYDYAEVVQALLSAMAHAKDLITQSIDQSLPGTRPPGEPLGKLKGQTAAQAFDQLAEVVNTGD